MKIETALVISLIIFGLYFSTIENDYSRATYFIALAILINQE